MKRMRGVLIGAAIAGLGLVAISGAIGSAGSFRGERDSGNWMHTGFHWFSDDVGFGDSVRVANLTTGPSSGAGSSALVMGAGTAAKPMLTSTAGKNFIGWWGKTTATSGDNRLIYARYYVDGEASTYADAMRIFATGTDTIADLVGAHISTSWGTVGYVSGQAIGMRATLQVPDRTLPSGGTYYGAQGEIYMDGTSSSLASVTTAAILSLKVDGGNATAQNTLKNAIAIRTGQTDGTGQMIYSHSHAPGNAAGSIRILVNGTPMFLKFYAAE